ncbi:HAD-IA family hydrolase [Vibrio sonorensis]|uniref:HAD-IA family hydrolase n=1 Tax=Vibrio sonorensis TaxID=1004316 RepID=UPI0008DADAE3|nr:HAD-IA family hydrolase [Vibrio sonorensis]
MAAQTRCIIFDCDGTLVDSERLCCQALVKVFNRFGCTLSMSEALAHFEGGKLADILSSTRDRLGINVSLDRLEPLYRQELDQLFLSHLKPMDGALNLIAYLKNKGVEFCVASNGPKAKIERALALTGMLELFEGKVFSAFDTNSWKPDPDLIRYSAMNMGFTLDECLYVDDTPKGLEAGINAGVKTVQLVGPVSRNHKLEVTKIHHLRELETML